jgi:hypothetical protein
VTGFAVLVGLLAGAGVLGFVAGRHGLDETDRGWLPPERRRWRP